MRVITVALLLLCVVNAVLWHPIAPLMGPAMWLLLGIVSAWLDAWAST